MAQPVFDEHPIEQYLRESGELPEHMPGEFVTDIFIHCGEDKPSVTRISVPDWVYTLFKTSRQLLQYTGVRKRSLAKEFAERFKYLVISSSLLSSTLSTAPSRSPPTSPISNNDTFTSSPSIMTPLSSKSFTSNPLAVTLALLLPAAIARRNIISGLFLLGAVKLLADRSLRKDDDKDTPWNTTLEALENLINSHNAWEESVSSAFQFLEEEDQSSLHIPAESSSSNSLRLALSSTLFTVQNQCDDVRQLFAALTSPIAISQLSHMYAPPSPSVLPPSPPLRRPASLSVRPPSSSVRLPVPDDGYTRLRTGSYPIAARDKRATWTGAYTTPTQRIRRRSNLSTLINLEDLKSPTAGIIFPSSAPTTPTPQMPRESEFSGYADTEADDEPFTLPSHGFRRGRLRGSSSREQLTMTSSIGSRYTSLNNTPSTSRNAPTASSLATALQTALGAKRFACAHLLALRFADASPAESLTGSETRDSRNSDPEADETYWEDVRSIIDILNQAFHEASSRLREALEEADVQRAEQEVIEEEDMSIPEPRRVSVIDSDSFLPPSSFAPMPGNLSRFSSHIDGISSALGDAKSHLQDCSSSLYQPTSSESGDHDFEVAMQAYERIRRELGLALREWERGRLVLQAHIDQRKSRADREIGLLDDRETRLDEPLSSDESDKTLVNVEEEPKPEQPRKEYPAEAGLTTIDDVTAHLLSTASAQHLPPPGIEQVFETDSAPAIFSRPRPTLSREERIKLARARREKTGSLLVSTIPEAELTEKKKPLGWGPSGEVVEELKDVIWKVGEHRRRMAAWTSMSSESPTMSPGS
ncbi:hypothetical protein M422DRAFT_63295 [Sphaerobolus stellatus SS14]|nr:hypothetical protein M422DRAFT_63295 [Sphaerobolus stellatus SS14]